MLYKIYLCLVLIPLKDVDKIIRILSTFLNGIKIDKRIFYKVFL